MCEPVAGMWLGSALMSEEFVFSWWLKDFVACAVSWIHVDFHGPCYTSNHTDVSGLCRHLRLWWCLGSELPLRVILMLWCILQPETMLMSMGLCFYSGPHQCGGLCCKLEPWRCLVHAASVDLIWSLGPTATRSPFKSLCWFQKPCWTSWSMLQRILKGKQISLALALLTNRQKVDKDGQGRLLWQPLVPFQPDPSK